MVVTIHGAVRFYAPAPVRAKRVPLAHSTAARPPSDKVTVPIGHFGHRESGFEWLNAVTVAAAGRE